MYPFADVGQLTRSNVDAFLLCFRAFLCAVSALLLAVSAIAYLRESGLHGGDGASEFGQLPSDAGYVLFHCHGGAVYAEILRRERYGSHSGECLRQPGEHGEVGVKLGALKRPLSIAHVAPVKPGEIIEDVG